LKEIYSWFSENHPYFKPNDASWQNSVRHNLSLNKCFINIPSEGTKGGFWSIDESVAAGFTADGSIPPTRPQRRRNRKSQAKSRNDSAVEVMEYQSGDGLAALAEAAARND
jgi:forkhead box protein J1